MEEFIGPTRGAVNTMLEVAEGALDTRAALSDVNTELDKITGEIIKTTETLVKLNARYRTTYQKAANILDKMNATAESVATADEVLNESLSSSRNPHVQKALHTLGALAAATADIAESTDLALDQLYEVTNETLPASIGILEAIPGALQPSSAFLHSTVDAVAQHGNTAFEVRDELQNYIADITGES